MKTVNQIAEVIQTDRKKPFTAAELLAAIDECEQLRSGTVKELDALNDQYLEALVDTDEKAIPRLETAIVAAGRKLDRLEAILRELRAAHAARQAGEDQTSTRAKYDAAMARRLEATIDLDEAITILAAAVDRFDGATANLLTGDMAGFHKAPASALSLGAHLAAAANQQGLRVARLFGTNPLIEGRPAVEVEREFQGRLLRDLEARP